MLQFLAVIHCQVLTKDQSHAQGVNKLGWQYSGFYISTLGPPAQEVSPFRLPLHLRTRLAWNVGSNTHQHHWVSCTPKELPNVTLSNHTTTGMQKKQPVLHFSMKMLPFDWYQCRLLFLQVCHCMWCLYYIHSLWQHGQGWIPAQNQNVPEQIKIWNST